jgi:hypothetical protein
MARLRIRRSPRPQRCPLRLTLQLRAKRNHSWPETTTLHFAQDAWRISASSQLPWRNTSPMIQTRQTTQRQSASTLSFAGDLRADTPKYVPSANQKC